MKALLIAEKPDLMRHIRDAYDRKGHPDDISFKSFIGHTMGLQMPGDYTEEWSKRSMKILPMIPKKFVYVPTADKEKVYKELKKEVLSGKYDYVINACDPGREGQHIFWSFYDATGCKLPVKRIWHADLTVEELSRALNNLLDENSPRLSNMKDASKLRAYFDWLVGMNYSSGFSLVANSNISAGRVMTPTLQIIVDRELEILNFKSKPFYQVEGNFGQYSGQYHENENDGKFDTKKDADAFLKSLGKTGEITFVEMKKQSRKAPQLFSLQTLQTEASKQFGYSMSETLAITQSLYEKKVVSYPRTDSAYLTSSIAKDFSGMLKPLLLVPEIKDSIATVMKDTPALTRVGKDKMYVDDKKVTDHYAITPTKKEPNLASFSDKQKNIYTLIAKRFLAIFLPPLVTNKTRIVTTVDKKHDFVSNGSVLVSKGFSELYNYNPKDQDLPAVKKGDVVTAKGYKLLEKKTTAPSRYTDGTLGTAMENAGKFVNKADLKAVLKDSKGIGTPATRGSIVDKLARKNMMGYRKKVIYATDYGISLIQALNGHDVTSVEMTAEWEGKLRDVEDGKLTSIQFYKDMVEYITQSTEDIKKMSLTVKGGEKKTASGSFGEVIGACPTCGGEVKVGKNFYMCENYKKTCNFILGKKFLEASISKTEMKKILSGKETKVLKLKGKKAPFDAKLKYNPTKKEIEFVFDSSKPSKSSSSTGNRTFKAADTGLKNSAGEKITEDKFNYYLDAKNYKVAKQIWGVTLTQKDVIALFDGKTLPEKEFTWKNGKPSKAKLYLDASKKTTAFQF